MSFPNAPVLAEANDRRHNAALSHLDDVRAGLALLESLPPSPSRWREATRAGWRKALRLRSEHPDETFTQLAQRAGVSKDTFAGRFRRALRATSEAAGR